MMSHSLALLGPADRRLCTGVVAYLVFASAIQVIGVTSIAPFIALMANPALIHEQVWARRLYELFGSTTDQSFMISFGLVLMAITVTANAVLAIAAWMTATFSLRVGANIQRDIFRGYLRQPFADFVRGNSSDMTTAVTNEVNRYVYHVLQPALAFVAQAFVVLFLVMGLVLYDPVVALWASLLLGSGYLLVFSLIRGRLRRNSEEAWALNARKFRVLSETLGGFKEITLAGTTRQYEEEFDRVSREALHSNVMMNLLTDLPRFALESLAFCAMIGLGIYFLRGPVAPTAIVGSLSLYAMAGYKLMPAAQSLFKSFGMVRGNLDVIDRLLPGVRAGWVPSVERPEQSPPAASVATLAFRDVSYRYPGTEADVLRHVTFTIPPRRLTVLVGHSGAGKSTAADLLLGLLQPTAGTIEADGTRIDASSRWRSTVGYVPQHIFLFDDTVAANVRFGAVAQTPDPRLTSALERAQAAGFVSTLADGMDTRVGERGGLLSGGQRQRVGIARALYREPALLILDEATSALDATTERDVLRTLVDLSSETTVVMVAHRLSTILAAHHVVVFAQGQVVDEGPVELLRERCAAFQLLLEGGEPAERSVL